MRWMSVHNTAWLTSLFIHGCFLGQTESQITGHRETIAVGLIMLSVPILH